MFSILFELFVLYMIISALTKIDVVNNVITEYIPNKVFAPGIHLIDWVIKKVK